MENDFERCAVEPGPDAGTEKCLSIICTENLLLLARDAGFLVWNMTFGGILSNRVLRISTSLLEAGTEKGTSICTQNRPP